MGFSIPHLLVLLAIVVLVFGTKRLKNVGADLGDAIKGFATPSRKAKKLLKLTPTMTVKCWKAKSSTKKKTRLDFTACSMSNSRNWRW